MTVVINGTTGISGVDGSAGTPAVQGTDTNTGVFYPAADTVGVSTGGSERVRVDSSGNVGIGTSSPAGALNTVGYVYQDNYASGTALFLRRANGTASSKTSVANGNVLGEALYGGYDGSTYQYTAEILGVVTGAVSSGVVPTALIFSTSATNTAGLTERMRIDSSGNLLFNSGYGSVATAYGCRAWVNFNGTGTVAIRASGNVSSITDNGVGDYTVNFTNAMPDANYSVVGLQQFTNDNRSTFAGRGVEIRSVTTPLTTSSCRVGTGDTFSPYSLSDCLSVYIAVFR